MFIEIDKIVWHKHQQYRPLPNTSFALMANLSLYENSIHNLNNIEYHILVEDYN